MREKKVSSEGIGTKGKERRRRRGGENSKRKETAKAKRSPAKAALAHVCMYACFACMQVARVHSNKYTHMRMVKYAHAQALHPPGQREDGHK